MLAVLPAVSSAFTLPPHGHIFAHAAPLSCRSPTPEGKDGLRRAGLRRAMRRFLPGGVPTLSREDDFGRADRECFDQLRQSGASSFTESPEEQETLVSLQAMLTADLPDASSAAWYPEVHGEARLLRFLRKSKGDATKASSRYREMLEWRRVANVDAVRDALVQECMQPSDLAHFSPMQRMMPVTIWADAQLSTELAAATNLRLQQRGLQIFHIGRWDSRSLVAAKRSGELTQEDFMEHWVYANEYVSLELERLSQERGTVAGLQLVCDFRGSSLRQVSRSFFGMVTPWAAMSQDNYPSTSEDIVFLNTPGFVTAIWGLISPMIGQQTQSRIRFASASAGTSAVDETPPPSIPLSRFDR